MVLKARIAKNMKEVMQIRTKFLQTLYEVRTNSYEVHRQKWGTNTMGLLSANASKFNQPK